ncbi:MAG TPA: aminomethyltransferase family protein [Pyrinomonadaceae bacterium]|nr:aminomethyltransferase family protein [Pyrinomonadaceae bacterium]
MSEVAERDAIHKSPLDEAHRRAGASMQEQDGWLMPASYGDVMAEYRAVREAGAGLIDLSSRGRIEVGGSEAVLFLNGLITNDVKALSDNAWMLAAFPNVQGRMLATARVLHEGETFLFDTEAVTREQIMKTLGRFTLAGDFSVRDVTNETALVSVQGGTAGEVVRAVLGEEAASVERGRIVHAEHEGSQVSIMRATHTAEDGFDLFTSAEGSVPLWEALSKAGARPVGFDALELLRIEAGLPRYGIDIDETKVVLETGLDDAVSFTKGCYIGQEIIARIHFRGHVAKRLAGVLPDTEAEVRVGDKLRTVEGKEIGWITSAARSPRLNRMVALGYVKYDYLKPGTTLRVISNDAEIEAQVSELPFVRGSWHAEEQAGES